MLVSGILWNGWPWALLGREGLRVAEADLGRATIASNLARHSAVLGEFSN
jgi:hypothetical protein